MAHTIAVERVDHVGVRVRNIYRALVLRRIRKIHKSVGVCDTGIMACGGWGPWLRTVCVVIDAADRQLLTSIVGDRNRPRNFTPTSASWLNAVENSKMTRQRIRRGVFRSIVDLQSASNAYLAEHNAHPKSFVWTQSANAILAKLDRVPVLSKCV